MFLFSPAAKAAPVARAARRSPVTNAARRADAVAPRNLGGGARRGNRASSFCVAALASEVEEEDATPSDGEFVSTASTLLPSGSPVIAGALPAASSLFSGLKVLVIGATGRTGREVVSRLVAEGVPVRCLVRDVSKARAILPDASAGVTLVRGDLTQPSSLLLAIADSNAVIWAAGVPSLVAMFKDPLAPLRVEAEGVANLVAAFERATTLNAAAEAERGNNGSKKKKGPSPSPPRFVLISSIGADNVLAQLAFPGGVLFWQVPFSKFFFERGREREAREESFHGGVCVGGGGERLPPFEFPFKHPPSPPPSTQEKARRARPAALRRPRLDDHPARRVERRKRISSFERGRGRRCGRPRRHRLPLAVLEQQRRR